MPFLYYFLENEKGVIPELRDRIGLSYVGAGDDDHPWATGYIGVAAMREDMEDPLWGYGNFFNGWTPSSTHFWNADYGDDVKTPIPFSTDAFNAFYKAKTYLFGGHRILYQTKAFDAQFGGIILGYLYSYSSIIELYKTGRCFTEGYVTLSGNMVTWEPEEIYMNLESARKMAVQILGRVAHLLTDMSVPAHAHNDLHADGDEYEDWMGDHYLDDFYEQPYIEPLHWDAWNAARQGPLLDVYQAVTTNDWIRQIRYLFYTTNQIADRFPSDDNDGDNIYSTSYNGDDYSTLNLINEISHSYTAGGSQPYKVNQYSFRYCIRAVAGLFYWFASETGIISKITAQNNFINGTIKVGVATSPVVNNSPMIIGAISGQVINLESLNQSFNSIERVWNTSGVPNSISKWQKQIGGTITDLPNSGSNYFSFTASASDDNSTYIANLMKNFQINRVHQTEFDGSIPGAQDYIVEQNSGTITAVNPNPINGKNYQFAGWVDHLNQDATLTFTPTNNEIKEALYKLPNLSNNSNGFSSGSQSKIVKTANGYLHRVYESMGYVWYEKSTDNGVTWQIENNGKPVSDNEAKLPSIDYLGDQVFIVYQEKVGGSGNPNFRIIATLFPGNYSIVFYEEYTEVYSINAQPVIGVGHNLNAMVVWRRANHGLFYKISPVGFVSGPVEFGSVQNTNTSSSNPTILANKNVAMDPFNFYLAWQQGTSAIKYQRLVWEDQEEELFVYDYSEPSDAGAVYYYNVKPSISLYVNNYPVITWIRDDYDGQIRHCALRIKWGSSWSQFYSYSYSYHMESVNINRSDTDGYFIISMAGSQNNDQYIKSNSTTAVYVLPTKGDVQVSNGNGFSGMCIQSFNKYSSPYSFNLHGTNGLLKSGSNQQLVTGRELGLFNSNSNFKACLSDIKVNDELITFPNADEFSNSIAVANFEDNFISNAFMLTDNSNFTFGLDYYFENLSSSTQNSTLKLKINLVDAETNNILETLKEVEIDKSQGNISDAKYFSVNTNGIGSRNVKLQMTVFDNSNLENEFTVTTKFTEFDPEFMKQSFVELTLDEIIITDYALAQNYPNPFNPTTTIKYQIPSDGNVSLKIYDVLGAEVMTLVNTTQAQGRYEVNFDASQLSSGVYIYRIQSNDYVASRKMMLLK